MRAIAPGAKIGNYILADELGRGGMGIVYAAQDLALKRTVAMKILAPHLLDDATARARFQREIKHAVAIEHPHVVPVYSAGYEDGHFYLAMRYVRGPNLFDLISQEGRLKEARALRIVGQMASALWAVHEVGIVHRDVKPQNVLIWGTGGVDEHAFLTDFGIARALDEVLHLTRSGALGTRGYMAPELFEGGDPSPACDQYSLAVLAYELLTGEPPFSEAEASLTSGGDGRLLSLALLRRRVSKPVCEAIERGLSSNPAERFQDVRAFVTASDELREAFVRSQAIGETLDRVRTDSELVTDLHGEHRLSDARIAEIADLEKSEVVRLRRRAARRSLIGE